MTKATQQNVYNVSNTQSDEQAGPSSFFHFCTLLTVCPLPERAELTLPAPGEEREGKWSAAEQKKQTKLVLVEFQSYKEWKALKRAQSVLWREVFFWSWSTVASPWRRLPQVIRKPLKKKKKGLTAVIKHQPEHELDPGTIPVCQSHKKQVAGLSV